MRGKLRRFSVIAERDNVIQLGKPHYENMAGQWGMFFKNTNPITLELACGYGEYSVALAVQFPQRNYIGVDIKGDRLWKGSTIALERDLHNVAFLRTNIANLNAFFASGEINEIWITFPDPRQRSRDEKRRLTHPHYLNLYKTILSPGAYCRLKTDNTPFFDYTLEMLAARSDVGNLIFTRDIYASTWLDECFDIKTRYEKIFSARGESIKYLRFTFTG